ncbi:eIF5-mimic protein 2-A-like [Saccoglossus kowalevskii]
MFLKGYTEEERSKLAKITALFLSLGRVQATILNSLFNDQLVKEGIALEFATEMFTVWLSEKDIGNVSMH